MSTHDYILANQVGSDARSDLNLLFQAIVSNNSSATEPATMYAYMFWADISTDTLKQRNDTNSAWINKGILSGVNFGFAPLAGSASQTFSVAAAEAADHAVPLAQTIGKNTVINPGFTLNQRVYVSAAVLAAGAYGHDRWKAGAGGGDYSFTQLASNTTITIAANKTLIQVIEDKNVYGGTYTLSWTGTALARYAINSATPSGAYAASPIVITGQTAGTTMSIEFGNGASAGTLTKVQLEVSPVATAFEHRPYGYELSLCQRYYETSWGVGETAATGVTSFINGFNVTGSGQHVFTAPYKVSKRTTPSSVTIYDNAGTSGVLSLYDSAGTATNGQAVAISAARVNSLLVAPNNGAVYGFGFSYAVTSEL